ncbi:MAG: oligosaccharide flippase family protein, partial [Opitutaceae bacterium]|nr:oligosaccharide flippase family protein [Opitutaceae bacterium]
MNLLNSFKKSWKSRYVRSAAVLMGSAGVGQLIGLATLPLTAILYKPSDLGLAQTVVNVLGLLGTICCGRLDQGLLLAPEKEIPRFMAAGFSLTLGISVLTAVTLSAFWTFQRGAPLAWWIMVPAILFIGWSQLIDALALRKRAFTDIARTKVERSAMNFIGVVGFGYLGGGGGGLLLSQVFQNIAGTWRLWKRVGRSITSKVIFESRHGVRTIFRENGHLLWGASGSTLVNSAAWAVPPLAVAYFYGTTEAGYLALAFKCVSPVSTFIISTLSQISIGEGARYIENNDHAGLKRQVIGFLKISLGVAALVAIGGVVAGIYAPLFLGEKWQGTSRYLAIFAGLVAMQLAINPLTCLPV